MKVSAVPQYCRLAVHDLAREHDGMLPRCGQVRELDRLLVSLAPVIDGGEKNTAPCSCTGYPCAKCRPLPSINQIQNAFDCDEEGPTFAEDVRRLQNVDLY